MPNLLSFWARTQESFCDKFMNIEAFMLLTLRESDAAIPVFIDPARQELAGLDVAGTTFVAYFIAVPEWD